MRNFIFILSLLMLFASSAVAADPLRTNCIAYWKMDQAAAANAPDATGNSRTFLQISSPTSETGKVRTSGGVNTGGSYYYMDHDSAFTMGSSDFSIAAWVYYTTVPTSGNYQIIISKQGGSGEFQLYLDGSNGFILGCARATAWGSYVDVQAGSGTIPSANTWVHVVGVRESSALKIYVNGELKNTSAFSGSVWDTGTAAMRIGKPNGATPLMAGRVDEVAIWKPRALTANEVSQLYNRGSGLEWPLTPGFPQVFIGD